MRQFKCPLAWCKWRAGSPLFDIVFSRGGSQREGLFGSVEHKEIQYFVRYIIRKEQD